MHVMACQIQADQGLKQDSPLGICRRQETEQTARSTPIRDHVQHSTELSRLVVFASSITVQGVQEAGYGIEDGAIVRVVRHIVERGTSEDDSSIA